MKLENYFNLAKTKNNLNSSRKLAKTLGLSQNAVFFYEQKRAIPSDQTMLKIADLAGVKPEIALLDMNIWRNEANPEVCKIYENLKNLTSKL